MSYENDAQQARRPDDHPLRILVLDKDPRTSLGGSYARAFRSLGHEVAFLNPMEDLERLRTWRSSIGRRAFERVILHHYSRRLLKRIVDTTVDLMWVGKGDWALPWLWRELRRLRPGVRLVCYNADDPVTTFSRGGNRPWVTASISLFDLYCTYNGNLVRPLSHAGARNVLHLPFAWDPELHPEVEPTTDERSRYRCDVLFIGSWDRHREACIAPLAHACKRGHFSFRFYGKRWERCRDPLVRSCWQEGPIYGEEMVKACRSATLCLNVLRLQNRGAHNMRTFEITGAAGCMISDFSEEQDRFFADQKAAFYYRSANELVPLVRELLHKPCLTEAVAGEGHRLAKAHTYRGRAKVLLRLCAEML